MQLKATLIKNGYSIDDATNLIADAKWELNNMIDNNEYIDDAKFMADWFNLEPDLFIELLSV